MLNQLNHYQSVPKLSAQDFPTPGRPVDAAMKSLDNQICELDASLDVLLGRLSPVLTPEAGEGPVCGGSPSSCALESAIGEFAVRVSNIKTRIRMATEALCI